MAHQLPLARKNGLAMEEVEEELLVYDLERDRAYCLNRTAALVWKHCDGRTAPAEMAKRLQKKIGARVDEKVVWYALDQLGRDRLLEEQVTLPAPLAGMSRRQHLRALGRAMAVAVPLVTAVVAPSPAQTVSPCSSSSSRPTGCPCTKNNQCQSNHCTSGHCT
jgi:hypothetical protein